MEKKVSILVPVFNVEPFLDRCIQSILNQTYTNIEVILVDDCSSDNSLSMCYEYAQKDKKIKVIKKESHTCLSDVRNIGIENATGEYIMFVDSDDYVCETFVKDMVEAIETKKVDVVRCKARLHGKDGSTRIEDFLGYEDQVLRAEKIKELIPHLVTLENNIHCYSWALILRKNIVNIRYKQTAYCRQDAVFFVELLLNSISSIYFLDKPLYEYCFNGNGTTHSSRIYFKFIEGLINSDAEIKKILKEHDLLNKKLEQSINNTVIDIFWGKTQMLSKNSIFNIYKSLKQAFKIKELQTISKNIDKTCLSAKKLIRYYLIKMHLYFLMAIYVKISN